MRTRSIAALSLTLLLAACTADDANEAGNEAVGANGAAPASSEGSLTAGPAGNGQQAPEPSGEVTLSAAPATASGGSTMTLTLSNAAEEQVGYNLCTSGLETSGGQSIPSGRVCTMELRMLEPGRSADYRYELPVNMVDGDYRFVTQVEWMRSGRRDAVRSNAFEVRSD